MFIEYVHRPQTHIVHDRAGAQHIQRNSSTKYWTNIFANVLGTVCDKSTFEDSLMAQFDVMPLRDALRPRGVWPSSPVWLGIVCDIVCETAQEMT